VPEILGVVGIQGDTAYSRQRTAWFSIGINQNPDLYCTRPLLCEMPAYTTRPSASLLSWVWIVGLDRSGLCQLQRRGLEGATRIRRHGTAMMMRRPREPSQCRSKAKRIVRLSKAMAMVGLGWWEAGGQCCTSAGPSWEDVKTLTGCMERSGSPPLQTSPC
jgi:hypothetical protein